MPITANSSGRIYISWIDASGNSVEMSSVQLSGYQPTIQYRYGAFISVEFNRTSISPSGFGESVGTNVVGFFQSSASGRCYRIDSVTYSTTSDTYIFHLNTSDGQVGGLQFPTIG